MQESGHKLFAVNHSENRKKLTQIRESSKIRKFKQDFNAEMDNDHGYENTRTIEIDQTPLHPIERPNGYYEGGFTI